MVQAAKIHSVEHRDDALNELCHDDVFGVKERLQLGLDLFDGVFLFSWGNSVYVWMTRSNRENRIQCFIKNDPVWDCLHFLMASANSRSSCG
ncbi:hypothetical protein PF008_g14128 [Phytophthora fragariae]|uniref:Uncharacterized protein n=1 Tax=Phytophthora fragariae TaxID=53985 RepID=A0A6G0RI25_9STRA|nr:hypothetical protein PF008_g14128 [Phytophthora fragariae]